MTTLEEARQFFDLIKSTGARVYMRFPGDPDDIPPYPLVDRVQFLQQGKGQSLWVAIWIAGYVDQVQPPLVIVVRAGNFESEDGWDLSFQDFSRPMGGKYVSYRMERYVEAVDFGAMKNRDIWLAYKAQNRALVEEAEANWARKIAAYLREHRT